MAWVTVDIDLSCDACGNTLEFNDKKGILVVAPCDKCMADAHTVGIDVGYGQGYEEGVSDTKTSYEGKIGELVRAIVEAADADGK